MLGFLFSVWRLGLFSLDVGRWAFGSPLNWRIQPTWTCAFQLPSLRRPVFPAAEPRSYRTGQGSDMPRPQEQPPVTSEPPVNLRRRPL